MPSPIFTGPSGASLANFRSCDAGVTFDAGPGPGPDLVLGSRLADTAFGARSGSARLLPRLTQPFELPSIFSKGAFGEPAEEYQGRCFGW